MQSLLLKSVVNNYRCCCLLLPTVGIAEAYYCLCTINVEVCCCQQLLLRSVVAHVQLLLLRSVAADNHCYWGLLLPKSDHCCWSLLLDLLPTVISVEVCYCTQSWLLSSVLIHMINIVADICHCQVLLLREVVQLLLMRHVLLWELLVKYVIFYSNCCWDLLWPNHCCCSLSLCVYIWQ